MGYGSLRTQEGQFGPLDERTLGQEDVSSDLLCRRTLLFVVRMYAGGRGEHRTYTDR